MAMPGILLKALRDTASIAFDGDSPIVALSGNVRNNVAQKYQAAQRGRHACAKKNLPKPQVLR